MTTPTTPANRLRDKTPCVIDYETFYTSKISLKCMSLRSYLAATHITWMSLKLGLDGQTTVIPGALMHHMLPTLIDIFARDDVVVVAHNDMFDLRVAHYLSGIPWPKHSLCTIDLAHAAFPNQPGGYSLENMGNTVAGMPAKLDIDLRDGHHTDTEMVRYVARDADCCAYLYDKCLARIGDQELDLAAVTSRARQLSLSIDQTKGIAALGTFAQQVQDHAHQAAKGLNVGQDLTRVFGLDAGRIKSVKPHGLKDMLSQQFGFETDTISKKKLNPEKLRLNPNAAAVIESASAANKGLSHQRRINTMLRDNEVDLNLNYAGSHTFRWTSRSSGKGVNFLNLPKHDKQVAPLIRGMLSIAGDKLLVRGDAATLEYRMNGWITECQHTMDLYESDLFADAYCSYGEMATGILCKKGDPERDVWKTTVLGLGFLMMPRTHALNLAKLLADEEAKSKITGKPPAITLQDFKDICTRNRWTMPQSKYYKRIRTQTGLDPAVIALAHHTHELFHKIHPEFQLFADWLGSTIRELAHARDPIDCLNRAYSRRNAPNPCKLRLSVDDSVQGRSVMLTCGPWYQPTLMWRDIHVGKDAFGKFGLVCQKEGNRGYRMLTPNILIENVIQAAGRNAMAEGMLMMAPHYDYILNVHDEVLLAVPDDPIQAYYAHENLIKVYGPGGMVSKKWGWTCVMDPKEINCSRSLWEEDVLKIDPDFWVKLGKGDRSPLALIP